MTLVEAVKVVLAQSSEPLSASQITERVLTLGLWKTEGKTPSATVSARLYMDIKKNGDASAFKLVEKGKFVLRNASVVRSIPEESDEPKGYSFTECAIKVLEESESKEPMHYRDITDIALKKGWLVTEGKTPEATMNAQIITEIKRYENSGRAPRFVRYGKGKVGLSKWIPKGIPSRIEQHNNQTRDELLKKLLAMGPEEFETLTSRLLVEMGFEKVEVTKFGGDGGIDVRGVLVIGDVVRIKMAVQVKRWKLNVQAPVVQNLRGSLGVHEQGLIITTSDFSKGARNEASLADRVPIALMNGEQLVTLLMEHSIGVTRTPQVLFNLDEDFLKRIDQEE